MADGSALRGGAGILAASLAYGPEYARLFLGPHLSSLLDPSNLPAVPSQFVLFTDEATRPTIEAHPRFQQLQQTVPTQVYCIPQQSYDHRYDAQALTLGLSLARAYREDRCLLYLTADGCYGQGAIPAMWSRINESGKGYDAVCGQAIRSAAEAIEPALTGLCLPKGPLFELGFRCLNPLWVASHWESPCFSGIPYALLWSDTEQLVMRMASVSVHLIRPSKALLQARGCPDMVLPVYMERPYFGYDWAEFPVVNVEPLRCFYPPFVTGHRASVEDYVAWAKGAIDPQSLPNLRHAWVYQHPDKRPATEMTRALHAKSDAVVADILRATGFGPTLAA